MMTFSRLITVMCFTLSGFSSVLLYAQNIETLMIKATVLEQLQGSIKGLAHTELSVKGIGHFETDDYGQLTLSASLPELLEKTSTLVLEIGIPNYQVIKPYEGKIKLDNSKAEMSLEIIVVGRDIEEEYREQLELLSKKLRKTQRVAQLSVSRMNALNDSLLISMQQNEAEKFELRNDIEKLQKQAEDKAVQNETLKNELEYSLERLNKLEKSLRNKENELYEALEERYLRQQEAEVAITNDLQAYLIVLRDVNDIMKNVDQYFKPGKHPNYVGTYNGTLERYNEIFMRINENYASHIDALKRYWNVPDLPSEAQQTFEILLDQIHHPKLKPAIAQINGHLRSGKQGKASKAGLAYSKEMNPLILNFEKAINRVMDLL